MANASESDVNPDRSRKLSWLYLFGFFIQQSLLIGGLKGIQRVGVIQRAKSRTAAGRSGSVAGGTTALRLCVLLWRSVRACVRGKVLIVVRHSHFKSTELQRQAGWQTKRVSCRRGVWMTVLCFNDWSYWLANFPHTTIFHSRLKINMSVDLQKTACLALVCNLVQSHFCCVEGDQNNASPKVTQRSVRVCF